MSSITGDKLILNDHSPISHIQSDITPNILITNNENRLNLSISKDWLEKTSTYDVTKSLMLAMSPLFTNKNKTIETKILDKSVDSFSSFKHIAFFIDHSHHYTGGRYSIYHQAVLLSQYTKVTIVTNDKPPFYDDFKDYYNDNFNVEINFSYMLDKSDNDFDLIVGCPLISGQYAHDYAKKFSLPLYMIIFESPNWISKYRTGSDDNEEFWKGYKSCLKHSNCILVPSMESAQWLRQWDSVFESIPIKIIYPCLNQIVADRIKLETIKPKDTINVLYISRMIPGKSPLHLFKHFPKDKHYQFHLIGKVWKDSENIIDDLRDEGLDIITHGIITDEEKFRIIQQSDVMIFPTSFEGFGMPPVEALYFGVPVVANDLPVLREIYKDNILYADMRNEQEFIHTVLSALNNEHIPAKNDWVKTDGQFSLIKNCANTLLTAFEIPKITSGTIVYNGSDYIEYAIKSIYPLVNQIIIVDGSVEKYGAQSIRSNDGTIEKIQEFKKKYDILDKIELVLRLDRPWKDKIEMQNEIANRVDGDYYVKLDHDEIWNTSTLLDCIKMLEKDKEITVIDMPFHHFWLNFKTVAKDAGGKWSTNHPRVWRWKKGFKHQKSFNFFQDSTNDMLKVGTPMYREVQYTPSNDDNKIFHFGYVRKLSTLQNKIQYYKTRGIENHVEDTVTNWKDGMPTQPTQIVESWSEHFTGTLPSVLDSHPYKDIDDIRKVE